VVRIVGIVADQLPEALRSNPVTLLRGFSGRLGQALVVADGEPVVYVGLGTGERWCPEEGYRALRSLTGLQMNPTDCDTAGLVSALSSFTDDASARELVDTALGLFLPGTEATSSVGATIAAATRRAMAWTNADSRTMNPGAFVAEARAVAEGSGLSAIVLQGDELRERGFGAIHGMGSGSPYPPALVDLRYRPSAASSRVTLVGKGVTFDTGGLSIKGAAAMSGMRQDKCGAATVLAVMSALRDLAVDVEVRAVLPVIENMIGPGSLRPGDVVTAWDGTRIHVMDTDFEGRVVLADALAYASVEQPDLIVDVATLTYQVVTALGPGIGGLFTRDDEIAARLIAASWRAGEALWRLPYDERYLDQVIVPGGVKNHPEFDTGRAITAALFLGQFVPEHTPWAHLDITGPAWHGAASSPGATGFGVRTLLSLLRTG
jgi:leucyl aminopeptidase